MFLEAMSTRRSLFGVTRIFPSAFFLDSLPHPFFPISAVHFDVRIVEFGTGSSEAREGFRQARMKRIAHLV
jgi:hypothetical protein